MKAIMISIRPQWVAKILNEIKTLEIRKKFPSDYVGWVYIYCCKQKKNEIGCHINYEKVDGKVVARFWCDRVEEICGGSFNQFDIYSGCYFVGKECPLYFEQKSCLTQSELKVYLGDKQGYAIHITKLEIFDEPKEISEFIQSKCKNYEEPQVQKAPQSWCYVEI